MPDGEASSLNNLECNAKWQWQQLSSSSMPVNFANKKVGNILISAVVSKLGN